MDTNTITNNIMTKKTFKRIDAIQTIMVVVAMTFLFTCFLGQTVVKTDSMEPTIHKSSPVIYYFTKPSEMDYNDIVFFFYGVDNSFEINNNFDVWRNGHINGLTIYVKRLMGKPGDVMEIIDGYMYRNGERLYDEKEVFETMEPYVVPENSFYCLGDNRAYSYDSVYCGAFSQNAFFGKKFFYLDF